MSKADDAIAGGEQSIEQLQDRYQKLHKRQIQAETNLDRAKEQLDALKQEARDKYATDDLEQLRAKLEAMKRENEEKRKNYQAELESIEQNLAEVESNFTAAETSSGSGEEKS